MNKFYKGLSFVLFYFFAVLPVFVLISPIVFFEIIGRNSGDYSDDTFEKVIGGLFRWYE